MFDSYQKFKQNSIFLGCKEEEIRAVYSLGHESSIHKDDYLIREGEQAKEIYLVLEGQLEITKRDAQTQLDLHIATLNVNDIVGELGVLDRGPRSASVRALTEGRLIAIPFDQLQSLAEKNLTFSKIFLHITRKVAERLRSSTETTVSTLKTRIILSTFLVEIIAILCIFSFLLASVKQLFKSEAYTIYVTLPLTLFVAIVGLIFVRQFQFPLSQVGITTNRWKQAVYEGIIFTVPVLFLILMAKFVCILFLPAMPLFKINPHFSLTVVYVLLVVPLQEVIARGIIQGSLEQFLSVKYQKLTSIVMADLMFSSFHVILSLFFGVIVFLPGLYFGWLYSRTHNLMGVWIAHALVGIWGVNIVGF